MSRPGDPISAQYIAEFNRRLPESMEFTIEDNVELQKLLGPTVVLKKENIVITKGLSRSRPQNTKLNYELRGHIKSDVSIKKDKKVINIDSTSEINLVYQSGLGFTNFRIRPEAYYFMSPEELDRFPSLLPEQILFLFSGDGAFVKHVASWTSIHEIFLKPEYILCLNGFEVLNNTSPSEYLIYCKLTTDITVTSKKIKLTLKEGTPLTIAYKDKKMRYYIQLIGQAPPKIESLDPKETFGSKLRHIVDPTTLTVTASSRYGGGKHHSRKLKRNRKTYRQKTRK
jgi:hypothetical protein